jgi:hypothetical protein
VAHEEEYKHKKLFVTTNDMAVLKRETERERQTLSYLSNRERERERDGEDEDEDEDDDGTVVHCSSELL